MKLGVLTVLMGNQPLADVAKFFAGAGVQAVEIGCGGYPGKAHCNPADLLGHKAKIAEFKKIIDDNGLTISALSAHGNMVHPDPAIAKTFDDDFKDCLKLAGALGVDTVVTFSGCPGGSKQDKMPNWVTCPWPDDFTDVLKYQWDDVMIPYWHKTTQFAVDHGVSKIALEMHPGFCVYSPETLMKLRGAVNTVVGANLDPSHLFWQGVDIVAAIRYLNDAIYYFHAKDTKVDEINTARSGVLDTKHYGDEINRAWVFRAVGYGHGYQVWKDIVSNLRMVGYDGVMSIEHEDSLMTSNEGLLKAIAFLKEVMMFEDKGGMFWA